MIHQRTSINPGANHYGVSVSLPEHPHQDLSSVLVQLQESGNQARVPLTPEEARHMAGLLTAQADRVDAHVRAEQAFEQTSLQRRAQKSSAVEVDPATL